MSTVNQIYAGAAQIEITPPRGTRINGDFVTHYATQIHDPLYAKCLVLRNGHEIITWVIVDICVMSQAFIDPVKTKIHELTHIPVRNILIASTHTHAAGAIEEVHLSALDMAYRLKLADLIPRAVTMAYARLQPAEITWASIDVPEYVLCRRYYMTSDYTPLNPVSGEADRIKTNPFGVEKSIVRPVANPDPEMYYMALRGLDGQWISVMGNYSLHYVGDWENGTISADYFGFFAQSVKNNLGAGDDFVGILTNGTSGDVNIWDFEGKKKFPSAHFEKSKLIGEDIANRLTDHLKGNDHWQRDLNLEVKYKTITQSIRKPTELELQKAHELVEKSDYESFTYSEAGLEKVYAREQIFLNETPDEREIPLQCFRIGDLMLGALPGEFFSETGLKLKNGHNDLGYFTIGLANGNVGYVPPRHEITLGGYETWRCRYSCLAPEAEENIYRALREMLDTISHSI